MTTTCSRCKCNEATKGDLCRHCFYFVANKRADITESWYWHLVDEESTDNDYLHDFNEVPCRFLAAGSGTAKLNLVYPDGSRRIGCSPGSIKTQQKVYEKPEKIKSLLKDHKLFYLVDMPMTIIEEGHDPSEYGVGSDRHIYYRCINDGCENYHIATIYEFINKMVGRCKECAQQDRLQKYSENCREKRKTRQINVPTLTTLDFDIGDETETARVQCNLCGHIFEAKRCNLVSCYTQFKTNHCPRCWSEKLSQKTSNLEFSVRDFLNELGVQFEQQKCYPNSKRRADFFFPSLSLILEVDGSYWHSFDKFDLTDTTDFFATHGNRTIHLYDFEWYRKEDIVKEKLKAILRLSRKKTLRTNKVEIRKVANSDVRDFYNTRHLMGAGKNNSANYGVFFRDSLVAACSFSASRAANNAAGEYTDNIWELVRYASDYKIYGILKKILACFSKDHPHVKTIISYADLRWTDISDNFYTKNGFIFTRKTAPNYYWVNNSKVLTRHQTQKHLLDELFKESHDKNMSEQEIMKLHNYHQVFDCGNAVYELKL